MIIVSKKNSIVWLFKLDLKYIIWLIVYPIYYSMISYNYIIIFFSEK